KPPCERSAETMNGCLRGGSIMFLTLCALALAPAGNGSAAPPANTAEERILVKPSTQRELRLPDTPYHYADIDLPVHFKTSGARRHAHPEHERAGAGRDAAGTDPQPGCAMARGAPAGVGRSSDHARAGRPRRMGVLAGAGRLEVEIR